ncbi:thioesterase domain-containing protein [Salicola sp. Rm-C-2C1-2]|uniref:thioesterase domain-containing protein n=1 Tax=Salicola sp. Rm-C-2C1-2 TaxID=3141321 RepID=UPI0032E4D282
MSPSEIQQYLHEHIPISSAMGVSVLDVASDVVRVEAPLEPNINHRATVFGGSASAVATLAAWSLLHLRVRDAGLDAQLVIQRNVMDYERPIHGSFIAEARLADPQRWERFRKTLERRGRARIRVESVLTFAGESAGHLTGEFVALTQG